MSKSIFYNTQFCRPKWRINVFYISLMNTRNAWRRISSLFMKCVVVVMLIYLHIFVGWLVLVYRCCCVQNSPPAFVSWSLGPMHVNKLENFASIRYCMAYYRLGTLDFVEICGILRKSLFSAHFCFAIIANGFGKTRWHKKNCAHFEQQLSAYNTYWFFCAELHCVLCVP